MDAFITFIKIDNNMYVDILQLTLGFFLTLLFSDFIILAGFGDC